MKKKQEKLFQKNPQGWILVVKFWIFNEKKQKGGWGEVEILKRRRKKLRTRTKMDEEFFEFLKNVSPYPIKENPWDKIKRRVKVVSFHPQSVQKIAALKIAFSKPRLFFHIIHFIIIFFGWNWIVKKIIFCSIQF